MAAKKSANEKTSPAVAKLAGKVLENGGKATPSEVKKLAASVLTQAANKPTNTTRAKRAVEKPVNTKKK